MLKHRLEDSIVLGMISGILGNLPKVILINFYQYMGWVRYDFTQMIAGIFIKENSLSNPFAMITGYITDFGVASLLGILLVYIMKITGKDFPISKGILYGISIHIMVFGLATTLNITSVDLPTPFANFLILFPNIIFGILAALIIRHYGVLKDNK